jgi:hypothetical protein
MGRLIDADELKNNYTNAFVNVFGVKGAEMFQGVIDQTKTAYDVEKVVSELEEYRANFDCRICKYNKTEGQFCIKDCTEALIDGLFDVVKRGGI